MGGRAGPLELERIIGHVGAHRVEVDIAVAAEHVRFAIDKQDL